MLPNKLRIEQATCSSGQAAALVHIWDHGCLCGLLEPAALSVHPQWVSMAPKEYFCSKCFRVWLGIVRDKTEKII